MVPAAVMASCALAVLAAGACSVRAPVANPSPSGSSSVSRTASASPLPPCTARGPVVDLGALAYDRTPQGYVHTPAGWYRLRATGFQHGGLFDAKVGRTTVAWGLASRPPVYHPGPSQVQGALGTAALAEGEDAWVELPDATLWFLNTYGARLSI